MLARVARALLIALTGFLAITAAGGGAALVLGFNCPPVALLAGTPFTSYVIPGLCLLVLVGGLALAALAAVLQSRRQAPYVTMAVGFAILIFEFVEILAIGSPKGIARTLQLLYVTVGLAILAAQGLGLVLPPGGRRPVRKHSPRGSRVNQDDVLRSDI